MDKGGSMFNPYQMQMPYQQVASPMSYPAYMEVDGEDSANRVMLPPNAKAVFFDRQRDRFYAVSTDAVGSKVVSAYDFHPVERPKPTEYLTVDAFNEWRRKYEQPVQREAKPADVQGVLPTVPQPAGGAAEAPGAPVFGQG